MSNRRSNNTVRDDTILDASLNALKGDGPRALDVLFKIKTGEIPPPVDARNWRGRAMRIGKLHNE